MLFIFCYLRFTIWQFVEPFVCFHIQRHATLVTFEACFVPCLEREMQQNEHKSKSCFKHTEFIQEWWLHLDIDTVLLHVVYSN